jgi:hypothetical protein
MRPGSGSSRMSRFHTMGKTQSFRHSHGGGGSMLPLDAAVRSSSSSR